MLDVFLKTAVVEREVSALGAAENRRIPDWKQTNGPYEQALVRAILDRRPYPVFVMDAALNVHLKNLEADARSTSFGLTIVEGMKLSLCEAETASRLKRLVRTMSLDADGKHACEVFNYEAPGGHCTTLSLSRVKPVNYEVGGHGTVLFLVSVRRHLGCVEICADGLMATFGLTKAEANLCAALAQNVSLQDYATREGIKVTTVRWHLQNVFERTGVNSQTELIAMIVSVML